MYLILVVILSHPCPLRLRHCSSTTSSYVIPPLPPSQAKSPVPPSPALAAVEAEATLARRRSSIAGLLSFQQLQQQHEFTSQQPQQQQQQQQQLHHSRRFSDADARGGATHTNGNHPFPQHTPSKRAHSSSVATTSAAAASGGVTPISSSPPPRYFRPSHPAATPSTFDHAAAHAASSSSVRDALSSSQHPHNARPTGTPPSRDRLHAPDCTANFTSTGTRDGVLSVSPAAVQQGLAVAASAMRRARRELEHLDLAATAAAAEGAAHAARRSHTVAAATVQRLHAASHQHNSQPPPQYGEQVRHEQETKNQRQQQRQGYDGLAQPRPRSSSTASTDASVDTSLSSIGSTSSSVRAHLTQLRQAMQGVAGVGVSAYYGQRPLPLDGQRMGQREHQYRAHLSPTAPAPSSALGSSSYATTILPATDQQPGRAGDTAAPSMTAAAADAAVARAESRRHRYLRADDDATVGSSSSSSSGVNTGADGGYAAAPRAAVPSANTSVSQLRKGGPQAVNDSNEGRGTTAALSDMSMSTVYHGVASASAAASASAGRRRGAVVDVERDVNMATAALVALEARRI